MEEQIKVDESTMLELNPKSVKEKKDAYSSLTDLYGVEVFTDNFIKSVNQEKKEKTEEDTSITEMVFCKNYLTEENTEDTITDLLFQENTSQTLVKEYGQGQQGISGFQVIMVGISMVGVLLVYRIFWMQKKGGRKKYGFEINTGLPEQ